MNWYLKVLKQYADFNGRARRTEYWMFTLFNTIFVLVAMLLDNGLKLTIGELPYGVFYFLYAFAVLIPGLAVAARRLHDVGKSGWMILVAFIPLVGAIWLLILTIKESESNENQYGECPKDFDVDDSISDNTADVLILSVVIWMFFTRVFWILMHRFVDVTEYYSISISVISFIMSTINGIVPIALAFVIKNKSKQITMFILGVFCLIIEFYSLIP